MEVNLGNLPFDLDFHPWSYLVATGLVSGDLQLYRFGGDNSQPQRLFEIRAHKDDDSCRAVRFINGGQAIMTGSSDKSILVSNVETGAEIARLTDAHGAAVNRLVGLDETLIASGDDNGSIKVWDIRTNTCCYSYHTHEDYISDISFALDSKELLATSGDGTLSSYSLKKRRVIVKSEFSEDEPLSLVIMKNGRKVICGTQNGVLLLYSWGQFTDHSDRFTGLENKSIDKLLKLDENRLITGSENGLISLIGILPNRIIRPIAEHSDYPVEGLAFSYDRKYLGSISHDQMLKLWSMDDLLEGLGHDAPDTNEMDADTLEGPNSQMGNKGEVSNISSHSFFAGL
ncbi:hypothetical protein GIB67_036155 [Kingdonia uniflora]|uniref:WD repeat-containing protein 55 n=1 Tax=Kingdonia uniflora TaxID=39325 RepID=A0A7J7N957_9MAGN|nr:hypothetical protein GIB67_036155 [Kingdonia uniflora]